MTNDLLAALEMWMREVGTRRSVGIDMGDSSSPDFLKVWCFDYDLMEGELITTEDQLNNMDLKKKRKDRIIAEYKKAMGDL